MSTKSPAQRRAIAIAIAKKNAMQNAIAGKGAYYKKNYKPKSYVTGKGAYKKKQAGTFENLGQTLGGVADGLLPILGPILGFGDYVTPNWQVKKNVLYEGQDPPRVQNGNSKEFVIRHREFLTDIITGPAGEFSLRSYKINPGLQSTFPWLAVLAQNFEQYELEGMLFEFKSTSADALNSTNTALGKVMMATEYDASRPNFQTPSEMENHQYGQSAKQSLSMLHPIECARNQSTLNELYVRIGDVPSQDDSRFYDFGNFQIATYGQQASNVVIGELWVTYQVKFFKPCLQGEGNIMLSSSYYSEVNTLAANVNYFANVGLANLTSHPDNNISVKFGNTFFILPPDLPFGQYIVVYVVHGDTATAITDIPSWSVDANSGLIVYDGNVDALDGKGFAPTPDALAKSKSYEIARIITVSEPVDPTLPRKVTWHNGANPGSTQLMLLYIASIRSGLAFNEDFIPYEEPIWTNVKVTTMDRFNQRVRNMRERRVALRVEASNKIEGETPKEDEEVVTSELSKEVCDTPIDAELEKMIRARVIEEMKKVTK